MYRTHPLLSIVCPVYQEEQVLPLFHTRLLNTVKDLEPFYDIEILYIDDGSTDGTLLHLRQMARENSRVHYLSLSRNFGHQAALSAGLKHAQGDIVVTLDSDLQHPPEVIHELLDRWQNGHDIVLTERMDPDDLGWFKRCSSRAFYWLMARMSETPVHPAGSDFRLLSRQALTSLLQLQEATPFLRGMVGWLGYRVAVVRFQAESRAAGVSHYTLKRMLHLALDGVTSCSRAPLRFPLHIGGLTMLAGVVDLVLLLVMVLTDPNSTILPHAILTTLLVLGGSILVSLGILGEYLARVLAQVRQRPLYLVRESHLPAQANQKLLRDPVIARMV